MQTHEEPPILNWADFIDALNSYRAPWPGPSKRVSRVQMRSLEEDPGVSPDAAPARVPDQPEA